MATRLMVCPPAHYDVRYAINPWMTPHVGDGTPDALRQWERLVELIGCVGDAEVIRVEPQAHMPDIVFTANAALMMGNLAVVSSFRHAERRREQPVYRAALARAGYATTFLRQTYFEGAGDALFDRVRPLLYAGYGWRTERGATLQLQEIVGCRVLPLLLVDERFYHLDTALCPLGSGHVLAYMDAFSAHAQTMLRRAVEPGYLIEVSVDDALRFACNAVEVGDAVIMHDCSRRLRERLHDAGYRVFRTELTEFLKAGGSAKCLTLRLDDGPAAAVVAATA
ncbi:MAG TPA: arginine deiminase-related protein [Candidatus Elarobacter sp.]